MPNTSPAVLSRSVMTRTVWTQDISAGARPNDHIIDLQRLLANRPVAAMNGGAAYVLGKGLRRHWPWVLAGALMLALMAGITAQLVHERDRAVMAERAALQRLSQPQRSSTPP